MKLLTSVVRRNGRVRASGRVFTLAFVAFVIGLEVIGRYATTDVHDGVAAFALLAVVVAVAMRHRREPLPWVTRLGALAKRVRGAVAWLRYDHGIDLRGTPPFPRRIPPVVFLVALALCAWAGTAAGLWAAFPEGWRAASYYFSYTLYLMFLLALWGTLLVITFVGVWVPVTEINKSLKNAVGDSDRRGLELGAVVLYAVAVSVLAWTVPPASVLILCAGVVLIAWVAYLPRGTDGPALLWRSSVEKPVYAVPLRRVLTLVMGMIALAGLTVLVTACGGRLWAEPRATDTMPLTGMVGTVAAWLVPGLLLVVVVKVHRAHRDDPARRTPPTLHVSGADPVAVRAAARVARRWGWEVRRAPAARDTWHVAIEIVQQEQSDATEFDPRWPLKVGVADLEAGAVKGRLDRRDEIKTRRQLFRGLQKLFKKGAAFKGPAGGGFWLAPHWWFVEGMGREDADAAGEDAPPLVGPAYSRALTPRARQHAHAVLRATQVDMIFIEDGVTYRNLERALRVLTELYDVHGGMRRAEELHFRGVPKVKVMIHEYEPGNPFRSDLYPEPKFDDLSRVRVMHIFRDRGGEEELIEPPFDFSSSPAPVAVLS
ncbi:MAG: hypothetical protein FJ304_21240 [Planctomycetes bacterium]|nr:hypothetical protein [Planctomycetota bacterium]